MIDDVLSSCLPVAAMAESIAPVGAVAGSESGIPVDTNGKPAGGQAGRGCGAG